MSHFLDLVRARPVVYNGSMGATILNLGLTPDDYGGQDKEGYNDYLSVVKPDVIETIHASFLDAGADVIETNTSWLARVIPSPDNHSGDTDGASDGHHQ